MAFIKRFLKILIQSITKQNIPAILIIFAICNATGSIAQETISLSLSDAIKLGLENNYKIQLFDRQVKIAQNNNTQGAAGRYPSISFTAMQVNRYDDTKSRTVQDERDKYKTNYIAPGVGLNWNLFSGFAVNISKKNLEALEELSEGNAAIVVENTIQGIILGYYLILLQQEKLNVFEEVKKLSRDRYQYMKTKQQFGSAVTFDVLQAKDAYLSDSVNYLTQKLNLQNSILILKLLLALEDNISFTLTDRFSVEINNYDFDTLRAKMLDNNKTLRNQFVNQKILEYSTSLSKSSIYPNLFFSAGTDYSNTRLKYEGQSAGTSYSFDYYANFSLSFNLFNGGQTRRTIRNAIIGEDIGLLTIKEMKKALNNELLNEYDLFNIRKKLLSVAEASRESTGLNLDIAAEKFKAGAINSFNYRDIQLSYLNASIRRLEAIFNLIDSETELLRLTGGIISEY